MRAMAETPTPWRCNSENHDDLPKSDQRPIARRRKGDIIAYQHRLLAPEAHASAHLGNSNRHKWGLFGRHSQPSLHKPEPLEEAGGWIHARRNFFKLAEIARAPEAAEAVSYMLKCWDASTHFPLATAGSA